MDPKSPDRGGRRTLYSPLVEAAIRLAARGHYRQFRKREGEVGCCGEVGAPLPADCVPYITHLIGTASILARLGVRDEVLAAAFLHDYLEDVPDADGVATIRRATGPEVLRLVEAVTEDKRPHLDAAATWETRKREQIDRIAGMPEEAVLVKVADLLHNLMSLLTDLEGNDDGRAVWERLNAPPERQLWYYSMVLGAARRRLGQHPLLEALDAAIGSISRYAQADTADAPAGD
jgi:hypothetical protein